MDLSHGPVPRLRREARLARNEGRAQPVPAFDGLVVRRNPKATQQGKPASTAVTGQRKPLPEPTSPCETPMPAQIDEYLVRFPRRPAR